MKRFFRSTAVTGMMLVLALVLLLTGFIGGTRAVLNRESAVYESRIATANIGVCLKEDGTAYASAKDSGVMKIGAKDLVAAAGDREFKIGKTYELPLSVSNTGNIDEYVRVTVYKYWVSPKGETSATGWFRGEGEKDRSLDPSLIRLSEEIPGWVRDDEATTAERTVYYYDGKLTPDGGDIAFPETVTLDPAAVKEVRIGENGKYVYSYDGAAFVLEFQVDAVQTHNGDDARISAWGLWKEGGK